MFVMKYLLPKQVAKRLGFSVSSIKRWADEGKLPIDGYTACGHRRFSEATVAAFGASMNRIFA